MTIIDKIIKENKLIKKPKEKKETIIENYNEPIIERDKRGNIIYHRDSDGYEYWKEYDSNNNVIHYRDSDGDEFWQEYDSNNNTIKKLGLINGKYFLNDEELIKEE